MTGIIRNVFKDVLKLNKPMCQRSGDIVEDMSVDILLAGFPCKDLSMLNNWPKEITSASGTTGTCLRAILRHCQSHKPRLVILENASVLILGVLIREWRQVFFWSQPII